MDTEKIITIIEAQLNRVFGGGVYKIARETVKNNDTEWIEFNVTSKAEESKLIYAVHLHPAAETVSLREYRVPYGSVEQCYRNGTIEQFSPFDDMTTPEPVSETIVEWTENELKKLS